MKTLLLTSTHWLISMFVLFIVSPPDGTFLCFVFLFPQWFMVAAGFILLIGAANLSRRDRRGLIAIAMCLTGLIGYYTVGFELGRKVLFQIRKSHFEELLQQADQTGAVPVNAGLADPVAPGKFAFFWYGGTFHNWTAVVYDPTGRIARINSNWEIFGGTCSRSEDMGSGWYICWFN